MTTAVGWRMNRGLKPPAVSAYVEASAELARQIREAVLDHEAFGMPLKVCELTRCRATCCHDGVYLSTEERTTIESLLPALGKYAEPRSSYFESRDGRTKTRCRMVGTDELAEDFPAHFPRTRCVFLDREHRCLLQRLARDEGRHPWFWKPVSCWLHPLLLRAEKGGRPVLTLARKGSDPATSEGYPGFGSFTRCGMRDDDGQPASRTLGAELEMLGGLAGRDLAGELAAPASGP